MNEQNTASELSDKLQYILDHGDQETGEMLSSLIGEFHAQLRNDPKNRVAVKGKEKAPKDPKVISVQFRHPSQEQAPEPKVFAAERKHEPPRSDNTQPVVLAILSMALIFVIAHSFSLTGPPTRTCDIKGNIGKNGEKIYHLPGTYLWQRTKIMETTGERWFCSEAEARGSGWRPVKK